MSGLAGRLETSAERLELSQANAPAPGHVEEAIRQELEAVALALSQQQRESGQDLQAQLGEFLRGELGTLKEAQSATAVSLQEKVGEWTSAVSENVSRVEAGLEKVLQSVEEKEKEKDKSDKSAASPAARDRRKSQNSDRP